MQRGFIVTLQYISVLIHPITSYHLYCWMEQALVSQSREQPDVMERIWIKCYWCWRKMECSGRIGAFGHLAQVLENGQCLGPRE